MLGYIPKNWRDVKVAFIPKAGRRPPDEPKFYRPISLTSFLLKTMEKILDEYIRSQTISRSPLHPKQFAYQPAKSTTHALHSLVRDIEKTLVTKEVTLCAFLDIDGAFDNTSHESIQRAAQNKGIDLVLINWIKAMLYSRKISASIEDATISVNAIKGCPQGGVLSLLGANMMASFLPGCNQP